ncbi:cationic peptide transport system permease protein [Pasteurella testudinis DSM 23072]|uniref:Cationic peptide transport system permease protein n=1 Tax=Pasteurella testudinis DSM 23072 TaxID=1122938 RepID=A0A1W1UV45_9PAST|nr:ABC transporter permease subunit [Pasteurella testudinis]SMB84849.1 cationic peptide transport system permease protein [Pasteurella testudinis DSM 23072]SUB51245.1 peptide transport system permease SapB [Pasteurella testudinis]
MLHFFRRSLLTLITLFILSLISYHILMRDPLNAILAKPHFYSGYIDYVQRLFYGDFGISYLDGQPLLVQILAVFPATIELCIAALFLAVLFGLPLGFLGAFHAKHWLGKAIRFGSAFGISLPVFWIAPLVLYFAAIYQWEISAIGQYYPLYQIETITGFAAIDVWFGDHPYQLKIIQNVLQHLALPVLVLMIAPLMETIQLIQNQAEKILQENYVKVAETRGWSKFKIARILLVRNTLPPLIPQLTRTFTMLLAMCMLIENIFSWPGIGQWLINAVEQQDYNAISAGIMIIGLFIILINMLSGFLMLLLDPFNRKGWYVR